MMSAADVRALLVTPDEALASAFSSVSRELGIATDVSNLCEGIPDELNREKYEALLIDFDLVRDAALVLSALRANPSNRGAVIYSIASSHDKRQLALSHGANFVLGRPLDNQELRRTLYAAYDIMTQERRRYFRCTAQLPAFLTRVDGSDLAAVTGNVSANGMSVCSSAKFTPGERLGITLDLQDGGPHVLARTEWWCGTTSTAKPESASIAFAPNCRPFLTPGSTNNSNKPEKAQFASYRKRTLRLSRAPDYLGLSRWTTLIL